MSWSRVQQVDSGANTDAAQTTRTVTFGATPTAGNLLVAVAVMNFDTTGLTMSSAGWTLAVSDVSDGNIRAGAAMWYKIAGSSESTTVTVTNTNGAREVLWAAEYSGNDATPLDVVDSHFSGSNALTFYDDAKALPTYTGGLHIVAVAAYDSNNETPPAFTRIEMNGGSRVGSNPFYHHPTGTSVTAMGTVWEKLADTGDDPAGGGVSGQGGSEKEAVVIAAVFRANGSASIASQATTSGGSSSTVQTQNAATGSATSIGATFGATPTAGNLIVVGVVQYGTQQSYTSPAGFTQCGNYIDWSAGGSTLTRFAMYYKVADGTEGSLTFSVSVAVGQVLCMIEFAGGTFVPDQVTHSYLAWGTETATATEDAKQWSGKITTVLLGPIVYFSATAGKGTAGTFTNNFTNGTNNSTSSTGMHLRIAYCHPSTVGDVSTFTDITKPGAGVICSTPMYALASFGQAASTGGAAWSWG